MWQGEVVYTLEEGLWGVAERGVVHIHNLIILRCTY